MISKFRVWDTVKKAMSEVQAIVYAEERVYPIYSKVVRRYVPFSEAILMQSTGHFDINSQEIFEGDLLDTSDPTGNIISSGNPILEVCFDGLEFTVKGDIENGEMSFREFKEICEYAGIPLKVIGNVYENPDLLEDV